MMKQRCYNEKNDHFKYYGGRGIKTCERWEKFSNFYEDMGERPEDTTLDRIDVNGDYEPDNCRWATREQQANNQRIRVDNKTGIKGVYFEIGKNRWRAILRSQKLGTFKTKEEAIVAREAALEVYLS